MDAVLTAPAAIQSLTGLARRIWKDCLHFKVLFCGLPVPPGESHLRIHPGGDRAAVLRTQHTTMHRLARQQGAQLLVFKELDEARTSECAPLSDLGYLRGEVPPMYLMPAPFRSFEEYLGALNSRYRNQVNRSIKKFQRAGFTVHHTRDAAEIEHRFTSELHRLYEAVWQRSATKLEKLPREFFHRLARAFPGQVSLTLLLRQDRVAAYTFGLASASIYHNLYSGLDYELNSVGDLYFNLFYHDLDQAFRRGFKEIQMGQTSDDFKAWLGCGRRRLWFYVRATGLLTHAGLRACAPLAFPAPAAVKTYAIFKANGEAEAAE